MKNILVPCDFSEPAISAYLQALNVAAQSNGKIHLLHVIEPPLMNDTVLMPTLNFEEELMKELKENAERKFKELERKNTVKKVKLIYKIEYGAVANCIIDYIKEQNIDLVLMGTNGVNGIKEYIIGSNAERVVRKSPVPVLVVKEYYEWPIKNIVFPNELDIDHQDSLMQKVKNLQGFFKATLHVVWINTPDNFVIDTVTRRRLDDFAEHHMLVNYTVNVFNHLSTESGIAAFAELINADIIAMGTHGRRGLYHLTQGSTAEDVVNHNKRLIWTCPLKAESALVY